MKKIILTLIAACAIAFTANAQFYGTGSLGFDLYSSSGVNSSSWNISPGVLYRFTEKSSAGAYVALGGVGSSFEWSVNPYYRFTFAGVESMSFFAEAAFNLGQNHGIFNWGVGIKPGVSYALSERFNIVGHFGAIGINGAQNETAFRLNILSNASFGVEFSF